MDEIVEMDTGLDQIGKHMKPVFFYGHFMDEVLLNNKGFNPSYFEIACIEGG